MYNEFIYFFSTLSFRSRNRCVSAFVVVRTMAQFCLRARSVSIIRNEMRACVHFVYVLACYFDDIPSITTHIAVIHVQNKSRFLGQSSC